MIRALIFDLDGTLTESKAELTPEMGMVLTRLIAKMPVAIMSGGSYDQFQKQLLGGMPKDANYGNLYLFPTSAAQCYTYQNGSWKFLYNNPFTDEERTRVLDALSQALEETGLDQPPPQLWGKQIEDRGTQITWSGLGQEAPYEIKKLWDPNQKKRLPAQEILYRLLPDFSVRVNAATSIDITRIGMTKEYGVRQFAKILEISIADMLYVGDALFAGGNDEIVKETGIKTRQVAGPDETAQIIEKVLLDVDVR